jgi:tripartite-type tricarboxylate transporter receptor subunit TctC
MKKVIWAVAAFVFIFSFIIPALPSHAQTYPSQPIQLVIMMAPGDSLDINGRAISAELSKILKTHVIPINKPGAGGGLGVDSVAKAKKDGYTILFSNSSIVYTYALNPENIPYNPFEDLDPLCEVASVPLVLAVRADAPWDTFQELVSYSQKNPGKVRAAFTGVGSVGHYNFEAIRAATGVEFTTVPFKGASPGLTAILGGHVDLGTFALSLALPHFEAGKIRFLLTSQRIPKMPNIPTLTQLGYKKDMSSAWFAFFVPTGTPEPVKKILISALEKAVKSEEVINTNQRLVILDEYKPAAEFKAMMREGYESAKQLLKMPAGK